jgi:hypothetical protein
MRNFFYCRFAALLVFLFSTQILYGQLEQVIHEEVATGPIGGIPEGYSSYRIFALLTGPSYRVHSISSYSNVGFEHRLQIGACSTDAVIWNAAQGGATGDDHNCSLYGAAPEVQYDSYFTLQRSSSCSPGGAIVTTPTTSSELNAAFATAPFGTSLSTFNLTVGTTNYQAPTGSDFRVLIAQVTVPTGSLVYALNVNVFSTAASSTIFRYVHTLDGPMNPTTEINGMSKGLVFGLSECALCSEPDACNYNSDAAINTYCENSSCSGCMDTGAINFDPEAIYDDGTCYSVIPDIVINEFCYGGSQNLPPNHPQHYFELYNKESFDVDLSRWRISFGMNLNVPEGTIIGANDYLVVTTPNQAGYTPEYNRIFTAASDNLSSLDSLGVYNNAGIEIDYIRWTFNSAEWPTTAFNVFASVALSNPNLDNSDGNNWCHSAEFYGSPGEANTCRILGCTNEIACNFSVEANYDDNSCIYCVCGYECGCMDSEALNYNPEAQWHGEPCVYTAYDVVINEIKSSSASNNYVELYNNEDSAVDISGYRLRDPSCCNVGFDFYFPDGTVMQPGTFVLVHGNTTNYNSLTIPHFTWTGSGNYTGNSANIKLYEDHGMLIDSVYTLSTAMNTWQSASSQARELENPNTNNAIGSNWCVFNAGTPGTQNSCYSEVIQGCMDEDAFNFEPAATVAGACNYADGGLTCTQAPAIICGQFYDGIMIPGSTVNDNLTAGANYCGFETINAQNWFTYLASEDQVVHIDLCYPETDTTFFIQIFVGECGELYCYDASNALSCPGTGAASLDFYADAGETYFIRISAISGNALGSFRMKLNCSSAEVGCNQLDACNYDPASTNALGCEYNSCLGCTNPEAINYDPDATIDDGQCYETTPRVVINEINKSYGSSGGYSTASQFIELYNVEDHDINITGWTINGGTPITFPGSTIIRAFDYIVIGRLPSPTVENLSDNIDDVFPFPNNYDVRDESYLVLHDAAGNLVDSVWVGTGFPSSASSQYRSTELINPHLDNNYIPNWNVTIALNQFLANTPGFQNTYFDPLGLTCQDSTACNFNPYIESNNSHCDYTCFYQDQTIDNDASSNPVVLHDGSTLSITRGQMASGNSAPVSTCNPVFHDAWFQLNTAQFDTVHVEFDFIAAMPTMGVTVYEQNGVSIQEVYCTSFVTDGVLMFEDIPGFDVNTTYLFNIYVFTNTCSTCAGAAVGIHANFFSRNCTDPLACNYNPLAEEDDGSCEYQSCTGCSDENACNYTQGATIDDGSCCYSRCSWIEMTQGSVPDDMQWQLLSEDAVVAEGGYQASQFLCLPDVCYTVILTDTASNGWEGATISLRDEVDFVFQDSTVVDSLVQFSICLNEIPLVLGCMDTTACNYNPLAEEDDGSCSNACGGCTIDWAMNYNPNATFNDGSCLFPPGAGITCSSPIQLFDGGTPFVFQTEYIDNDNFAAGLTELNCITNTNDIDIGQYWFIYTDTVSTQVNVYINQAVNTCLGFGSTVHVFRGTCGDFDCEPYDFSSPYMFQALAGETYYIRAVIDESPFGCNYSGQIFIQSFEIEDGCTDEVACNYNDDAVVDDGNCDYACLYGCMNSSACNYDPTSIYDDGSCFFNCIYGCLDESACNYDSLANTDDGTCIFLAECFPGCTDVIACNYDPGATFEDFTCTYDCLFGCLEEGACNYAYEAIYNDFSCDYSCFTEGCMDELACNYNAYSTIDNGSCLYDGCVSGCTQPTACNYNAAANTEDFSCVYGCFAGCIDVVACNYNASADFDDGSCSFPGCMNSNAVNYDPEAACEGACYFDCIADLDGSGSMDMSDFLLIMAAFGCIGDCAPFDLNGDDIVGSSDLQLFLAFYGVLCAD